MGAADRPEFAEIPAAVRERVERQVRRQAFDVLHAEAVERGDINSPPFTRFDKLPGKLASLMFAIVFGVLIGSLAVMIVLYVIRALATVF